AEAGPGDFIYVPPFVPHQEINANPNEPLECVLVRSDNEAVGVNLDIAAVAKPTEGLLGDPLPKGGDRGGRSRVRRPMDADQTRGEIAELEDEIETLRDVIERCRKIMRAAQAAIGAGALLLLAQVTGALAFEPIVFMAATAALLGGIVLFGSNN